MDEGEVSSISQFVMSDGMKAYRIIKIMKRLRSISLNLIDDFTQINDAALNSKKQNRITEWVDKKISNTFIRLSDDIDTCESLNKWKK